MIWSSLSNLIINLPYGHLIRLERLAKIDQITHPAVAVQQEHLIGVAF